MLKGCGMDKVTKFELWTLGVILIEMVGSVCFVIAYSILESDNSSWIVFLVTSVVVAIRLFAKKWNAMVEPINRETIEVFILKHKKEIEYLTKMLGVSYDVNVHCKYVGVLDMRDNIYGTKKSYNEIYIIGDVE